MVLGRRLVAAISHDASRQWAAHHGPEHEERLFERHADLAVVGVHQRVGPGLDLGDAGPAAAEVEGAGTAGGHHRAG